jgi:hypothetical protein
VSIGNASPPRPRAASSRPEPAISWHQPSRIAAERQGPVAQSVFKTGEVV